MQLPWLTVCAPGGNTGSSGGGTSLMVQWLILHASNAGSMGLKPGQGTRSCMPHGSGLLKKKKSITWENLRPTLAFIVSVEILNSRAYSDLLHSSQLDSFSCIIECIFLCIFAYSFIE